MKLSTFSASDPGLCCPEISFKNGSVAIPSFAAQKAALTKESREQLEKAMVAREKKYGYKRGSNASLQKPAKYADIPESKFADPVGYNYTVTAKYIRGALSYWNQPKNRRAYKDPKARTYITLHIIKAALAEGIVVTYNSHDPEYAKLPGAVKRQLKDYDSASFMLSQNFNSIKSRFNVPRSASTLHETSFLQEGF